LPVGSLFIVVRGMILDRNIPIAVAKVPMAFNQDMKAIVPNDRVDGEYPLLALRQFREQLRTESGHRPTAPSVSVRAR
jgi:type I restriction enzyme S subunit